MAEVRGSTPLGSTYIGQISPWALGGYVAGEGCFTTTRASTRARIDGSVRLRFVFEVTAASRDADLVQALHQRLTVGSVRRYQPSNPQHLEAVRLTVSSRRAHFAATIPFMERYLLPCAKRRQYEKWRDALVEHDRAHPSRYGKGPSPCSVPGCECPVRGRGLCRSHYYRATGY